MSKKLNIKMSKNLRRKILKIALIWYIIFSSKINYFSCSKTSGCFDTPSYVSSIHFLKFLEYVSVVISFCELYCLFRELEAVNLGSTCRIHGSPAATAAPPPQLPTEESVDALCNALHHWHHCPELYKAIEGIRFIADHTKREEDSTRVIIILHNCG